MYQSPQRSSLNKYTNSSSNIVQQPHQQLYPMQTNSSINPINGMSINQHPPSNIGSFNNFNSNFISNPNYPIIQNPITQNNYSPTNQYYNRIYNTSGAIIRFSPTRQIQNQPPRSTSANVSIPA
jgi:hypothetical protein